MTSIQGPKPANCSQANSNHPMCSTLDIWCKNLTIELGAETTLNPIRFVCKVPQRDRLSNQELVSSSCVGH